jgi:hypothetical protein
MFNVRIEEKTDMMKLRHIYLSPGCGGARKRVRNMCFSVVIEDNTVLCIAQFIIYYNLHSVLWLRDADCEASISERKTLFDVTFLKIIMSGSLNVFNRR